MLAMVTAMGTTTVSLVRVPATAPTRDDVLAGVRRAMELAGWQEFIPRGAEVSLKPNLGWDLFLPGAITSPWAFEGVVRTIRDWVGKINVVESDQVVVDVEKAFRLSRIDRLCKEYDLTWVNMTRGRLRTVPLPHGRVLKELTVPEILLRTKLVTVPVIKTHNKTVITGAIKNQWGCLPMFRHNYHLVLDAALADINSVARPCFAVMDATIGLEGNSPKSGIPKIVNRVLASGDAVALDAVAAKLMGFDPAHIGHLKECVAAGLGVCGLAAASPPWATTTCPSICISSRRTTTWCRGSSWSCGGATRCGSCSSTPPCSGVCCKITLVYYAAWYYVLGIGRARRDRILTPAPTACSGAGAAARQGAAGPMRIGIIGGGVAGLGCAYFLAQRGHHVEVFEQAPALGGLAGCFDFDGMQVEKYYHFVCRDDVDLIDMLARARLVRRARVAAGQDAASSITARCTRSARRGTCCASGHCRCARRIRFGLNVALSRSAQSWERYESMTARDWLIEQIGQEAYDGDLGAVAAHQVRTVLRPDLGVVDLASRPSRRALARATSWRASGSAS